MNAHMPNETKHSADEALQKIAETFKVTSLPESEIEMVGEVPFEVLAKHRTEALAHLAEHAELPGFRKGHVPLDMVEKRMGEIAILQEAVELLIRELYPQIVIGKKVEAVGRPEIRITKLAPGNPVGLAIRTAIFPELKLPDYKKIARAVPAEQEVLVTDEEVEKAIENVRASRAVSPAPKEKEGSPEEAEGKPVFPELTDEFVRTLGPFDTVALFKEKLKEHLRSEKERVSKEKRRSAIADTLIEKTAVTVPRVFVESELEKIVAQMKDDIGRMAIPASPDARPGTPGFRGLTWDEYLTRLKKTEDDVRNEFRDGARKRAILQLALNAIADKEDIKIPAEDIEREAGHILEHFKDADRERVHIYAESVLKNEKVLSMLEAEK